MYGESLSGTSQSKKAYNIIIQYIDKQESGGLEEEEEEEILTMS